MSYENPFDAWRKELERKEGERRSRINRWNKKHGKDPWEIKRPYEINRWTKEIQYHQYAPFKAQEAEVEKPHGTIIYTPHDCVKPDPTTLPIGTIWECHDYTCKKLDGHHKMCYDQWIIVCDENGNVRWSLFKRNF